MHTARLRSVALLALMAPYSTVIKLEPFQELTSLHSLLHFVFIGEVGRSQEIARAQDWSYTFQKSQVCVLFALGQGLIGSQLFPKSRRNKLLSLI